MQSVGPYLQDIPLFVTVPGLLERAALLVQTSVAVKGVHDANYSRFVLYIVSGLLSAGPAGPDVCGCERCACGICLQIWRVGIVVV